MKALVSGGAGFIGSNVVKLLLEKGAEVTVLDNLSTGHLKNLDLQNVRFVNGDIRDAEVVEQAVADNDTVFHFAANISRQKSIAFPQEDLRINILGTVNLLEAARKNGAKKFVYSSSAAIFGELQMPAIDEQHPTRPDCQYGVSKFAGEKYVLSYGMLYELGVVCLRYFNVYGVNQRFDEYGNVVPIFASRMLSGKPITIYGDGEQTRDFVNVKDVARANYLAATVSAAGEVYNVGTGFSTTVNRLAELLQEVSGIKGEIIHAEERLGDIRHCKANNTKLQAELGFEPSPDLKAGLQEYFDWYKVDFFDK